MSLPEIKKEIAEMTEAERRELSDYLRSVYRREDAEWSAELARRRERVLEGEGFSQRDLEDLDAELRREGR
ncbi:MAG: hypothetical protein QOE70_3457 [Chthoniobacter sp.]|jgi:hypothetical protein|nr:hypothetical protein [Chthoniobacter sp.]